MLRRYHYCGKQSSEQLDLAYNIVITWVQELGQKRNLILVNTRELNRILVDESTLYTFSIWSAHTLHLVYSKCYESCI